MELSVGTRAPLAVTVEETSDGFIVSLDGELDAAAAPRLAARLEPLVGNISFDCSALRFIDSAGVRVMVSTYRRLDESGFRIELRRLPIECLSLLESLGLAGMFRAEPGQGANR
jgi:anti-sigma B factor antagonist